MLEISNALKCPLCNKVFRATFGITHTSEDLWNQQTYIMVDTHVWPDISSTRNPTIVTCQRK